MVQLEAPGPEDRKYGPSPESRMAAEVINCKWQWREMSRKDPHNPVGLCSGSAFGAFGN